MAITEIKPFTNSSLDTFFGKLKAHRVTTDLQALHRHAKRSLLAKSFLAIAALASAIAIIALANASIFFLGLGVGILILSTYGLYHCLHQHKHANHLFNTATKALTQI